MHGATVIGSGSLQVYDSVVGVGAGGSCSLRLWERADMHHTTAHAAPACDGIPSQAAPGGFGGGSECCT